MYSYYDSLISTDRVANMYYYLSNDNADLYFFDSSSDNSKDLQLTISGNTVSAKTQRYSASQDKYRWVELTNVKNYFYYVAWQE